MTKENKCNPDEIKPDVDDFSQFYLQETTALDLDLPDGEPMTFKGKQVSVHLFGPSTSEYRKATEKLTKAATRHAMQSARKKDRNKSDMEEDDIQFLIAITQSFENFPYPGGVEGVFREPKLSYIEKQIRAHIGDLGNFFGSGKKN